MRYVLLIAEISPFPSKKSPTDSSDFGHKTNVTKALQWSPFHWAGLNNHFGSQGMKPLTQLYKEFTMKNLLSILAAIIISFGFAGAATAAEKTSNPKNSQVVQMAEKVDLNKADAETLANSLHRVGQKKAEAIVAWRKANGKFTSVEQLIEVKGIGEATVAANRDRIVL